MSNGPLLVFDLDGTLVDSRRLIETTMQAACSACGWPAPAAEDIWAVVGLPLLEACRRTAPAGASDAELGHYADHFHNIHSDLIRDSSFHPPLFPGILELLDDCISAGAGLAIATGKPGPVARDIIAKAGIGGRFGAILSADDGPGKPDPYLVKAAMNAVGPGPWRTVVVIGDSRHDMEMAVNAGVPAIGVSWGFERRARLLESGAYEVVDTVAELRKSIEGLTHFDR